MNDGAAELPATLDNFDAIVSQYNDRPAQQPSAGPGTTPPRAARPATPELPNGADPATGDPRPQGEPQEPLLDENGQPIEEEPAEGEAQPELDDLQLAQQARAWLEGEPVPEEMLGKLTFVTKDGTVVTGDEALNNFTRRGLLTQKEQQTAATRNHYEQLLSRQRQQWEGWGNDPVRMETELEDMGFGPQLEHIARKKVNEYAQEMRMLERLVIQDPRTGQWVPDKQARAQMEQVFQAKREHERSARQAAKRAQFAASQVQQQQGNNAHDQRVQKVAHQMAQFGPRALRELGVPNTPYVRQLVSREMALIHRPNTELTYEMVKEAAKNAKDLHDMEREQGLAKRDAANPRRRAAMPRGTGNPRVGAAPNPQTQNANRARISDFDAEMKEQDKRAGY